MYSTYNDTKVELLNLDQFVHVHDDKLSPPNTLTLAIITRTTKMRPDTKSL